MALLLSLSMMLGLRWIGEYFDRQEKLQRSLVLSAVQDGHAQGMDRALRTVIALCTQQHYFSLTDPKTGRVHQFACSEMKSL